MRKCLFRSIASFIFLIVGVFASSSVLSEQPLSYSQQVQKVFDETNAKAKAQFDSNYPKPTAPIIDTPLTASPSSSSSFGNPKNTASNFSADASNNKANNKLNNNNTSHNNSGFISSLSPLVNGERASNSTNSTDSTNDSVFLQPGAKNNANTVGNNVGNNKAPNPYG